MRVFPAKHVLIEKPRVKFLFTRKIIIHNHKRISETAKRLEITQTKSFNEIDERNQNEKVFVSKSYPTNRWRFVRFAPLRRGCRPVDDAPTSGADAGPDADCRSPTPLQSLPVGRGVRLCVRTCV